MFWNGSVKTESVRRWSNKWTKTLYQDYLHCIANFRRGLLIIFSKQFISSNTKRRKRMLNFELNTWKFWWNETDDEILPVFPHNQWTLKFLSFPWEIIFRCYFRQLFMYLALRKCKKDCKIVEITLVQIFAHCTKTWNCSIFCRISS